MQQSTSSPALAPVARSAPSATQMYEAAKLMRSELRSQQGQLMGERQALQDQLNGATKPADVKGLSDRLVALDARIADVDKQLAAADARVASSAAVPGVVIQEQPRARGPEIPPEAVVLGGLSIGMVLLLPVSIAFARRIWRRAGQPAPAALPPELGDRMAAIERAVESVAIEVERIGEGQRFVTQLLAETEKRKQQQVLPVERSQAP